MAQILMPMGATLEQTQGVADEVQRLQHALGVEDRSLIKESYADLIGVAEEGRAARSR